MLNFKEIKEKYPKSFKLLTEWTKETLLSFQRMIMSGVKDVEMPEITDEMAEKALDGFIKVNYRLLFDFCDKNGQQISITFNQVESEEYWEFGLPNYESKEYKTRIEAEIDGINKAFEQLEKQ